MFRGMIPGLLLAPCLAIGQAGDIAADPDRMEARIQSLGQFGANREGGVSRVAFSEADIAGRRYIGELMREAGLEARIDTAGNIIGRREGTDDSLPSVDGISHSPKEYTSPEDMANGATVLLRTVLAIDNGALE